MKVVIVPYTPEWKKKFEAEKIILSDVLKELNPEIEHIGSTSVEGLGAKPIVDIQIGMPHYDYLDKIIEPMINAGYTYFKKYEDTLPDRRLFCRIHNPEGITLPKILYTHEDKIDRTKYPSLFNIHCVEINTPWWKRHIAFRDYLRSHPEERERYQKLKEDLASKEWNDINDYAQAKTEFVKSIEKLAGI